MCKLQFGISYDQFALVDLLFVVYKNSYGLYHVMSYKVCLISHRIWTRIYRIWNQIQFQFHLVWFWFCFDLVSNLKLKRNMIINTVLEIRIHKIYFQLVLFFCESVSKLKSESGMNPGKPNSHILEKPKQMAQTNSQIRETETRFMKPHRNCD